MAAEQDCLESGNSLRGLGSTGPTEWNAATLRRGTESSAPNRDTFSPNIFLSSDKALKIPFNPSIQWSQSALQMLIRVKPHKTTKAWESAVILIWTRGTKAQMSEVNRGSVAGTKS